ncbi:MAG TPA: tRNA pseudouridine(13) synthase TruD [Methanoculleus sp.]|nr:tRNA pseudouridine(13) synthase TruD [Methanoculleus sp.]
MKPTPHPLEHDLGMRYYATDTPGIGGVLRTAPEDFVVEELPLAIGDEGAHLICRLTKRNWETQRAVKEIARALGISHRRIGWAGTKDRRAVTTQYISIYDASPDDLERITLRDLAIEAVGRARTPLNLGDLEGNRFAITIRDCRAEDLEAETAIVAAAAASGLPNYFGIQRFGGLRPVTHKVGLHMLRGEFKDAVRVYVGEAHAIEPEETRTARTLYAETMDAREVLGVFPVQLRYERALLHHLVGHQDDYRGALQTLPPKLLSMFVSAYQSYLFNMTLSRRMEEAWPMQEPVPGDVLLFGNGKADLVTEQNRHTAAVHLRRKRCVIALGIPGGEAPAVRGRMEDFAVGSMEDDGVQKSDFARISAVVGVRFAGAFRPALITTAIGVDAADRTLGLRFTLPPGTYATTVCREFMKAPPEAMI